MIVEIKETGELKEIVLFSFFRNKEHTIEFFKMNGIIDENNSPFTLKHNGVYQTTESKYKELSKIIKAHQKLEKRLFYYISQDQNRSKRFDELSEIALSLSKRDLLQYAEVFTKLLNEEFENENDKKIN